MVNVDPIREPVHFSSLDGKIVYPPVRRSDCTDSYHGIPFADPYRWLEDPDSKETEAFVEAQNTLSEYYMNNFESKPKFKGRLTELFNYERFSAPHKRGEYYYFFRNSGLQPQSILYQVDSVDGEPRVFLNPNNFAEDGSACLANQKFSPSGKLYAYSVSRGSDWNTISFMDYEGNRLEDKIEWAKFTNLTIMHDDNGLFYASYDKIKDESKVGTDTSINTFKKLWYHRMGTKQSEDILVYADAKNPSYSPDSTISDDGRYLIVTTTKDCDNICKLYMIDLEAANYEISECLPIIKIVDVFEAQYSYLTNEGALFYFQTNKDAPLGRIVKYDLSKPEEGFTEVVAQTQDVLSCSLVIDKDKLILQYIHDVKSILHVHDLKTGKFQNNIKVPIGTIAGCAGQKEDREFFIQFMSYLTPGTIYRYSFEPENEDKRLTVFRQAKVNNFDKDMFETKQVFYESKDCTKIPMFITYKKDLVLNGNHPAYLYGYGGFGISVMPAYSPELIVFIQNLGGVVAYANIRGGGEYGEEWHKGGILKNKQNGFDDFYCAAQYLINEKYTTASRLTANGASNGGLLAAATINQAPELFGCVVVEVGVMDLLRFHKFTIGHAWQSDYGRPEEKKDDFISIIKYSPVHNVHRRHPYPAVAIFTSSHDDRVVPLHSYKFIAELQYTAGPVSDKPMVARISLKTGHGAGKAITKRIHDATDKFAFIAYTTGAQWTD
ncbi:hypothetical protein BGX28_008638 [Mortierella sp. GBA30]|nr:hypothetical protein BGX28_008638 [Mortierella sp. GBA30]